MLRAIVFDVNETLLDLSALDEPFAVAFGDAGARAAWFRAVLHLSACASLIGATTDFTAIGLSALESLAQAHGVSLDAERARALARGMRELPAHADVIPALERLQAHGFRLVALTNSATDAAEAQLRFAGIRDAFECVLSVDLAGRFKPAPEVYRMTTERLRLQPAETMLVAAHAWDVWGAMATGMRGAFVARPGQARISLAPPPTIEGPDLRAVCDRILSLDRA